MIKSHEQKRSWSRMILISTGFFLLVSFGDPIGPPADKTGLSIIIPGIDDHSSNDWLGNGSLLSPGKEKYVVINKKEDAEKVPSLIPKDHIILFDEGDKKTYDQLAAIGKDPNATVIIDMDLGSFVFSTSPFEKKWDNQTNWASLAAVIIADAHQTEYKDQSVTLFGHSAGTEAVGKAQQLQQAWIKSGEVKEPLFNKCIAASPRDLKGIVDKNTMLIVADGDFVETPGGKVDHPFKNMKESDAISFAKQGYDVIRIVTGYENTGWILDKKDAHTQSTEISLSKDLVYYSAETAKPKAFTGSIEKMIDNVVTENAEVSKLKNNMDEVFQNFIENQPTDGLGGISLNTVAAFPFNAKAVKKAGWDAARQSLFILMKDGRVLRLPSIDPQAIRLGYESAFKHNLKPELSIGSNPVAEGGKTLTQINPPGMFSVYYLGKTENTYLGLAMFLADRSLGNLAFGSSADIYPVSKKVPGFHCMAELFAAKYTNNPAMDRWLGTDARVFLNTGKIELGLKGDQLFFNQCDFEIHFPEAGPAENYFASFLTSHFNEVAETNEGRPLKDLIPFAKAVAVWRWLKTNNIPVDAENLDEIPVLNIYTPAYTPVPPMPSLDDISPLYPITVFDANGPQAIYYDADKKTVFSYEEQALTKITGYNHRQLEILRDAMGLPIAFTTNDEDAGAFYIDPKAGPVFFTNVFLQNGKKDIKVRLTNKTMALPENQPGAAMQRIINEFIQKNEPK